MPTALVTDWVSVTLLLAALESPPPEMAALTVTASGAFAATFTVTMISEKTDGGERASERVQVSELNVQVQPKPPMAVGVSEGGTEFVTVTRPLDAMVPTFTTFTK